ncbi:MAG: prepilin-type N-terminal cleavage/methylation domain-containing protein [Gemmatimonadales bacterium]|nr:MAG: prepilin-type N-terminal cleavage/methylation domain-containing protein [Gemmatimonadales bacterium]
MYFSGCWYRNSDRLGRRGTSTRRPRPTVRAGFTLVELLIVVLIIGILAMIAIPRYMESRAHAFRSAAISDLRNLWTSQEIYWSDDTGYSNSLEELDVRPSRGVDLTITAASNEGWAAQASHSFFPAMTCGIYYGSADPSDGEPAEVPGVVSCSR